MRDQRLTTLLAVAWVLSALYLVVLALVAAFAALLTPSA